MFISRSGSSGVYFSSIRKEFSSSAKIVLSRGNFVFLPQFSVLIPEFTKASFSFDQKSFTLDGFFDHVPPPATIPPDHHLEDWTFDRLGVRVPAILVSSRVENGVNSSQFDHTSLLRYVIDKWDLGPLGLRAAQANSFADSIVSGVRTDMPPSPSPLPLARFSPFPCRH